MRAFNEISTFDAFDQFRKNIISDIESKSKEYILGIDDSEYKNFLYDKYYLEPLTVHFDQAERLEPIKSKVLREDPFERIRYEADAYSCTVKYSFSGSAIIFRFHPSTWSMTSYDIKIDEHRSVVSLAFMIYGQNVEDYNRELQSSTNRAFANVSNANNDVNQWNNSLKSFIEDRFDNYKSKLLQENDFFAAINVPIDKSTQTIFSAPTIKKKDIPQPKHSKSQEYSTEPVMSKAMYDEVLKVIYDTGKGMERKPSLYIGKDEEALRDIFILLLESRYEAMTTTGETFNRSGKTDILVKYAKDGSNLFIAECKFWHGQNGYIETINQLFDRYLTWRDSKVAIIMFVQNKDFTSVINNIANVTRSHPYFVQEVGRRYETSFSYIFTLPQDPKKNVFLEVMAFHYDKLK